MILAGRDEAKLQAVRDELVRVHGEDRFPIVVVDMASLASVREAVERILATESRLDAVIDNAGAIFPTRQVTADGIEATLATMVVGPFALVAGLLPLLEATRGARVISVTSGGQYAQRLHLDDLQWTVGAVGRDARVRPCQAGAGQPHPRVGAAGRAHATSRSSRCTRAGRTPRASRPPCRASTA